MITITKDNFEKEVLQAEGTVLVDFWAAWCMPCKMLSPILDEVAAERPDIKIGKINVDDEGELSIRHGVMSIPTLIVFKNGEIVNKSIGLVTKEDILALL
jgi:thioredoxin 1